MVGEKGVERFGMGRSARDHAVLGQMGAVSQ
jgi:hypothetical protein